MKSIKQQSMEFTAVKENSKRKENTSLILMIMLLTIMIGIAAVQNIEEPSKPVENLSQTDEVMDVVTTLTTTLPVTTTTKQTTTAITTTTTTALTTVTSEEVTAPSVTEIIVVEEPVYDEPIHEEVYIEQPPVIEDPVIDESPVRNPEPEPEEIDNTGSQSSSEQIYYSDDGNLGYSSYQGYDVDSQRYHAALSYVTEEERIWLVNLVASESGSDWISIVEKAKVVAVAYNRLQDGYWGDSYYSVLTWSGQFTGYYLQGYYYRSVTPTCIDAVDYFFSNIDSWEFSGIKYISGHGTYNTFS